MPAARHPAPRVRRRAPAAPATTAGSAPGTTTATAGTGAALDQLRLGFAYIGPINDNGWTQEHHRGRQLVFDTLGDKVTGTYVENVLFDPAQTTPIFEDLAQNHDFVIANTEYATLLSDVAAKYPDVHFLECDGHTYLDNLYSYYVRHVQPTYALGVAAALLNEGSPVRIGYIGAFPTATAYNDVNGLILGARTINPDGDRAGRHDQLVLRPAEGDVGRQRVARRGHQLPLLGDGRAVVPAGRQRRRRVGGGLEHRRPGVRARGLREHPAARLRPVLPRAGGSRAGRHVDGQDRSPTCCRSTSASGATTCPEDVSAAVDELRPQLLDESLNPYTGPIVDNQGTERLAEGETLDAQQAYLVDWAVEGVSGVEG